MGEKEMFLTGLCAELQAFRNGMLKKGKTDIYASAGQIEAYASLFNILADLAEETDGIDYGKLLCSGNGMLESLYGGWADYDGGAYLEMKRFVIGELRPYLEPQEGGALELKAA